MARFLPPESFGAATEDLSLLPFKFERAGADQYRVANMVGDFIRLTEAIGARVFAPQRHHKNVERGRLLQE